MIDSIVKVLGETHWQLVSETPDKLILESCCPRKEDLALVYPFVAAGCANLNGRASNAKLYDLEPSGYARFDQGQDDQWSLLFGHSSEATRRHRRRLAAIWGDSLPIDNVFVELEQMHSVASVGGYDVTCHLVLKKDQLVKLSPEYSGENRLFLWFSAKRFRDWFEHSDFFQCLYMFSHPVPPTFYVQQDAPTDGTDLLLHNLGALELPLPLSTKAFHQEHAATFRQKKRELSAESKSPLVHPRALMGMGDIWWASSRFRVLAAYATLCLFAHEITFDGAQFTFLHKTLTGLKTTRIAFGPDSAISSETVPLDAAELKKALEMCQVYDAAVAESDSLKGIWTVAVDRWVGNDLAKVLVDPHALIRLYRELKDSLLKSNLDKLLSTHEKAQGAVLQAAGQFFKDVDGLGGDVEKAILAGIGSGVLTLLGTVVKLPSLDLAAPIGVGLLVVLFFPNVYGRITYFQSSLNERERDLALFLDTLKAMANDALDLSPYQQRFQEHLRLAKEQIGAGHDRMNLLFGLVHSMAMIASLLAIGRSPNEWSGNVASLITAAYSAYILTKGPSLPVGLEWYVSLSPVLLAGWFLVRSAIP